MSGQYLPSPDLTCLPLEGFLLGSLNHFIQKKRYLKLIPENYHNSDIGNWLIKQSEGLFVSVYVDGKMRGCKGNRASKINFYSVQSLLIRSSFMDTRFIKIKENELNRLMFIVEEIYNINLQKIKSENDILRILTNQDLGIIFRYKNTGTVVLPRKLSEFENPKQKLDYITKKSGLEEFSSISHSDVSIESFFSSTILNTVK